jgi:hypothetical protein
MAALVCYDPPNFRVAGYARRGNQRIERSRVNPKLENLSRVCKIAAIHRRSQEREMSWLRRSDDEGSLRLLAVRSPNFCLAAPHAVMGIIVLQAG